MLWPFILPPVISLFNPGYSSAIPDLVLKKATVMSRNVLQSAVRIEVKRSLLFFFFENASTPTWPRECRLCAFSEAEPVSSSFSLCVTEVSHIS